MRHQGGSGACAARCLWTAASRSGGRLSSLEHPCGCRVDWCFWSLKITRCWERVAGSARSTVSTSREQEDVSAWEDVSTREDASCSDPPQAAQEWSRVPLATGFQFITPSTKAHRARKKHRKKALVQDDPGTTRYQRTWVWCCSSRLQSNPSPTSTSLPSHPNPFQHVEDFRWGKGWDEGAPELAADAGMTHLTASSLVMQPSTYAASPSPLSSVAATHRMEPMSNLQEQ